MSSTTMIPRIRRLSGLARRRSSTSSLVAIADDEMPTAPAMTNASRVPHPSAKPSASPPPTLSPRKTAPAASSLRPPPMRSSSENSSPRWNSSRPSPSAASSSRSSGSSTSTTPGVPGPNRMPATMKNGMVGSPMRRPRRASSPAARKAPPTATSVSPTGRSDNVLGEGGEVLTTPDHHQAIAGAQPLGGLGGDDRAGVACHGRHGHPRAAADLQLGDAPIGAGRIGAKRHPVDEDVTDHGLHLLDHGRREVGAAQHGAEGPGLAVGERQRRLRRLRVGGHHVQVAPARVMDDDDGGSTVAAG